MAHQGYGFCEFLTEEDAEYACKIMNQIKLWGKPIRVNKVSSRLDLILWKCSILTGVDSATSFLRFHACQRLCIFSLLRMQPITASRRLRTKNSWMSVRTCSLEVWTRA